MMRQAGVEVVVEFEEGGGSVNTGQNNDTKFFCVLLFLFGDLSLSLSLSQFPSPGLLGAWRSGWDCLDLRTVSYL